MCGVSLRSRPDSFWMKNTWTPHPDDFKHWPAGAASLGDEMAPCQHQSISHEVQA